MIPSFYKSPNRDFTLLQGDCVETLSKFQFGFDMVFADPPYFLSGGGISYQSGHVVCVDKGDWDKPKTPEEMDQFNYRWIKACRDHMKDNATIWISGTYHNFFSVQQQAHQVGFQDSQRHHMGQDQSATQHLLPLLHLFHRVHHLGAQVAEGATLL